MNGWLKTLIEKNPVAAVILIIVLAFTGGFGASSATKSTKHIEEVSRAVERIEMQLEKNRAVVDVKLENLAQAISELNERLKVLERR